MLEEFGAPLVIDEVDLVEPGEGEVVVDVEWSSVNGMDAATVNGVIASMMPAEFPITLGRDFSGTVAAVGSGVTDLAVGDPVFGMLMSLNMLVEFGEAFDYTGQDFRGWCKKIGFAKFETIHLQGAHSAAVAYK